MRRTTKTLLTSALLLGSLFALAEQAQAIAVSCPNTSTSRDREFILKTTNASTCLSWGTGNFNSSPYRSQGYGFIDKWEADEGSLYDLIDVDFDGFLWWHVEDSGDFDISSTVWNLYSDVLFVMKSAVGQYDPDWAVFKLAKNTTYGDWEIKTKYDNANGLSYVSLYGKPKSSPTPPPPTVKVSEPTTIGLLGAGLFGLAWLRRRRTRV